MGEYQRIQSPKSPMPPLNDDGTYPAVAAARVSIARTVIRQRSEAGLTQKALAEMAGIRVETLNRIEKGKVTPDTATIAKIDRALKRADR
jgi:DNA-binding XRE family transcriptional regulator